MQRWQASGNQRRRMCQPLSNCDLLRLSGNTTPSLDQFDNEFLRSIVARCYGRGNAGVGVGGDDICAGAQKLQVRFQDQIRLISICQSHAEESLHRANGTGDLHSVATQQMPHAAVQNHSATIPSITLTHLPPTHTSSPSLSIETMPWRANATPWRAV